LNIRGARGIKSVQLPVRQHVFSQKERIVKASMLGVSALAFVLFGSAYAAPEESAKPASSAGAPAGTSTGASSGPSAGTAAAPQAASAKSEARPETRGGRLTRPWRDLPSLSEEQKKQITAIHRKAVQETNAIEEREKADIMALLNEQQKSELKSIQEKDAAERKARAGNRSAARPTNDAAKSSDADKKQ
jgi:hypothetical protein